MLTVEQIDLLNQAVYEVTETQNLILNNGMKIECRYALECLDNAIDALQVTMQKHNPETEN